MPSALAWELVSTLLACLVSLLPEAGDECKARVLCFSSVPLGALMLVLVITQLPLLKGDSFRAIVALDRMLPGPGSEATDRE